MVGVLAVGKGVNASNERPGSMRGTEPKADSGAQFGQEVRRRRESQGMTLDELSERSGLTPNYIGTIENGKRDPSLSTILALARGLGAPAGELLGAVPDLSAMAAEAARLFDESPPEVQEAIYMVLRAVMKRRRPA